MMGTSRAKATKPQPQTRSSTPSIQLPKGSSATQRTKIYNPNDPFWEEQRALDQEKKGLIHPLTEDLQDTEPTRGKSETSKKFPPAEYFKKKKVPEQEVDQQPPPVQQHDLPRLLRDSQSHKKKPKPSSKVKDRGKPIQRNIPPPETSRSLARRKKKARQKQKHLENLASDPGVVIEIQGSIGAGKSSALKYIAAHYNVKIGEELVDLWSDGSRPGSTTIHQLYSDPKKHSTAFQYMVLKDLLARDTTASPGVTIRERSIQASVKVFAKNALNQGFLSLHDYNSLKEQMQLAEEAHPHTLKPDLIIYMKASPETAKERIQLRNREGEQDIPLEVVVKQRSIKCFYGKGA